MNTLESLDQEVNEIVEQMAPEVILLLIEKLERDIEIEAQQAVVSVGLLLNKYVALKIMYHHLMKAWNRGYGWSIMGKNDSVISKQDFISRSNHLDSLIKNARRNYYVAKRRVEGEHPSECPCRGCRCLKGI